MVFTVNQKKYYELFSRSPVRFSASLFATLYVLREVRFVDRDV
jgi:hypothetical protein